VRSTTAFSASFRVSFSLGLLVLAAAAPAEAQPDDSNRAMAEALFRDGKQLLTDGHVAEACRKFEASYHIEAVPGTLLNMALCHEREGKTAIAWAELNQSLARAKEASPKDRKNADRKKIVEEHLAALERRLARLVLTVTDAAKTGDLKIELDHLPVEPGAYGTSIPVDPGQHTATAEAPGKASWKRQVTISEGETVTLVVPALAAALAPPPPPVADWKRPVGFAALGVGAVGVGIGVGFGVAALNANAALSKVCSARRVCPDSAQPQVSAALTQAKVSDVGLSLGVAFAAAGGVLLLLSTTAPSPPRAGGKLHLVAAPVLGPGVVLGFIGGLL
jgi:hypothetical protein